MRIKKREIEENQQNVNRQAKAEVEKMKKYVPGARDSIMGDIQDLIGDPEEADKIANNVAATAVGSVYGGDKKVNEVVNGDAVVQFDSERSGEEPFYINGIKWQYVNAIYPDGKKDIAVYRFDHDLAYDYDWFMNEIIPKPANSMNENNPMSGEDFGDIPTGRDIELDADAYDEYQSLLKSLNNDGGEVNYGELPTDNDVNDLPFESVRPKMTKNQLIETVLGKKTRKVLKTIKKKDL